MASGTFDWYEGKLRGQLRGQTFTFPTTVYVAVLNDAPTGSETGATLASTLEPHSSTGYARFPMPCNSSYFTASSSTNGITTNNTDIFWTIDSDGFEANHWAIMDSATGGNGMWFGPIDPVRTYDDDDTLTIPTGSLSTQFGGVTV